jgi:hypothetical protein
MSRPGRSVASPGFFVCGLAAAQFPVTLFFFAAATIFAGRRNAYACNESSA